MTETTTPNLTQSVAEAIDELRKHFPEHRIEVIEDGAGGAHVKVHDLSIGESLEPSISWVSFSVGFQYPRAHVYPHFVRADLTRTDGAPIAPPMNTGHTALGFNEPAIMVSRSSPRWNPATDTAAHKLLRVLQWLRER